MLCLTLATALCGSVVVAFSRVTLFVDYRTEKIIVVGLSVRRCVGALKLGHVITRWECYATD